MMWTYVKTAYFHSTMDGNKGLTLVYYGRHMLFNHICKFHFLWHLNVYLIINLQVKMAVFALYSACLPILIQCYVYNVLRIKYLKTHYFNSKLSNLHSSLNEEVYLTPISPYILMTNQGVLRNRILKIAGKTCFPVIVESIMCKTTTCCKSRSFAIIEKKPHLCEYL